MRTKYPWSASTISPWRSEIKSSSFVYVKEARCARENVDSKSSALRLPARCLRATICTNKREKARTLRVLGWMLKQRQMPDVGGECVFSNASAAQKYRSSKLALIFLATSKRVIVA